jgi:hypothetical protein
LVPALGLTGLLPKLIRAADNINLSGLAHWVLSRLIVQDPIRRIGEEEGCNRGGQAFRHGPRSQFELLRVVPAKISAPF